MKRFLPPLLIFLGIFLIVASLGAWRYSAATATPKEAPLPSTLAGLPLTYHLFGPQAAAEVTRLHGKSFALSSAALGIYGEDKQATLWVSGAPVSLLAARMVHEMQTKIAQGNSPFIPLEDISLQNHRIYQLEGLGQRHYYYQSKSYVIWLAVDAEFAEQALEDLLAFFP
jgi:hypothetical protein